MLGAIAGDTFGAAYEGGQQKHKDFDLFHAPRIFTDDFEHTLRLAISLGGDADTQAAIAGGVAEAFFGGLPERIETEVRAVLEPDLLDVVDRFNAYLL